jgi:DNA-binding HxlR family transcriptional regulator
MVKRTSTWDEGCPVARALDVIGDWWSLLIVRDAFDGVTRFSQFQQGLGIAKGMLATRLRELVDKGILRTAPVSDRSAYRQYVLTAKGEALFPVIVTLRQWAESELYTADEPHSRLVERATGRSLAKLHPCDQDGRKVKWTDTRVDPPKAHQSG